MAYTPPAVLYELAGINGWMARGGGLTGAADGKKGIFSCWFKWGDNIFPQWMYFINGHSSTNVERLIIRWTNPGGLFQIYGYNSAATLIMQFFSPVGLPFNADNTVWHHLLVSWDLTTAGNRHLYLDNVLDLTQSVFLTGNDIDYTTDEWVVGQFLDSDANPFNRNFNGCLAQMYLNLGEYLDFSIAANREKFITSDNFPIDLGSDASGPTGTQPIVYLQNALATHELNDGSGGDFVKNGILTACATQPPLPTSPTQDFGSGVREAAFSVQVEDRRGAVSY